MSISFKAGKFNAPEAQVATGQALSDLVDEQNAARATAPTTHPELDRVIRTIWRLRQADGCPWDKVQTHASISGNMIEEAYEAVDTIETNDPAHMCEEFGDVLEQVLLHSQIAADAGEFTIDDVAHGLNEKLVRRHPHVFGELAESAAAHESAIAHESATAAENATAANNTATAEANTEKANSSAEALDRWDDVKRLEREARGELAGGKEPGLLDSIPTSLPALMQAQKISNRAVKAGFEWNSTAEVWDKVAEERAEFLAEEHGTEAALMEFGDILFALVNVARREGIDAEKALAAANTKFRRRWAAMEAAARAEGKDISELSTAEQNDLWNQVKHHVNDD